MYDIYQKNIEFCSKIVQQRQCIKQKLIRQTKKNRKTTKLFAYRRCSIKYVNNIKLHQHIRDHHVKKSKIFKTISIISSFLFHFAFVSITYFISSMTSFKITWTIIAIKSIISKFSRLFKLIILIFTFSQTSSQTSILKHQSIKNIKSYFIVTNFYVMFHEKIRIKNLKIIQIDKFFFVFKFKFLFQMNRSNSIFLRSISIRYRDSIFFACHRAIVEITIFILYNLIWFFVFFSFRCQFWITCSCMHEYTSLWRTFWY